MPMPRWGRIPAMSHVRKGRFSISESSINRMRRLHAFSSFSSVLPSFPALGGTGLLFSSRNQLLLLYVPFDLLLSESILLHSALNAFLRASSPPSLSASQNARIIS